MKAILSSVAFGLCLLTGLGMLFIGGRFFLAPVTAEHAYGIAVDTGGNFAFHYIKGVRDIFSGLGLVLLLLTRQFRALGIYCLCAVIIPATDMSIVVLQAGRNTPAMYPHLAAVVIVLFLGVYYIAPWQKKS